VGTVVFTGHLRRTAIIDCNRLDFESDAGLLACLDGLAEHRCARGIRHSVSSIIAVAVVATMSGAKSYPDDQQDGQRGESGHHQADDACDDYNEVKKADHRATPRS
jgi:hypothetical protein